MGMKWAVKQLVSRRNGLPLIPGRNDGHGYGHHPSPAGSERLKPTVMGPMIRGLARFGD